MNDHDAITAINAELNKFFRGDITADEALRQVCYISGMNAIDHTEATEAQK